MQRIDFHSELDFTLLNEERSRRWIKEVILSEDSNTGEIDYIFCDDEYLQKMHVKFMGKDSLTDILTFDYSEKGSISGDIFISIDRVRENAEVFKVSFEEELKRVMIHGVLHLLGYADSNEEERSLMRQKEEEKMKMFHVEQ